ncbi:MAG: DHA2 family efflux MFS transporter permease subunit [Rhodospirillaceae bacterium]|nr:DHA2 family efflux MFS transporter permease subunit [Rhodospirillaceae bacterium]
MTTAAIDNAAAPTAKQRWLLLGMVVSTATLYSMTLLVVSVVLPQIQGSLSASPDQISWAMTYNILATAVVTPISGWLAGRFGWRRVMLFSLAAFGISSVLCGLATSLETLVLFRILQGGFGAPLVPLTQAVTLSVFPRHQHRLATSIFGMGVVIGPIIGPIYGGYLSEIYDWRWVFFMIGPMALAAWIGLWALLPDRGREMKVRFTWFGFVALAVGLGCLQLILDRGQRLDWLDSFEIVTEVVIGLMAFGIFIAHSLLARTPLLDFRHLANWNYTLGLMIVTIYGMLNFPPMVMLPPMLKELGGYPDSIIGILIAGRGSGAVVGFFVAAWIGKLDPRVGVSMGFLLQAWSGWIMWNFNADVAAIDVMTTSCMQGLAVGLIWVPLTVSTFANVETAHMAETSAVYHLLRNVGSSIFISLSVTTVIRTQTMNYGALREYITPFNEAFHRFSNITGMELDKLGDLARLNDLLTDQAQMIGFLNAFGLYTMMCLAVLPLILMIRPPPRK